jgi:hypothetical protein
VDPHLEHPAEPPEPCPGCGRFHRGHDECAPTLADLAIEAEDPEEYETEEV